MLYREIIAICFHIHTKHINTLCGQNIELLNVKLTVHKVTTQLWRTDNEKKEGTLCRMVERLWPFGSTFCLHIILFFATKLVGYSASFLFSDNASHCKMAVTFRYTKCLLRFNFFFIRESWKLKKKSAPTRINLSQVRPQGRTVLNAVSVPIRCMKFLDKLGNY